MRIIDVSLLPDYIVTNKNYTLYVNIQKLVIQPVNYTIQVYLLDGVLGTKLKTIGEYTSKINQNFLKSFKRSVNFSIRDEDVNPYIESYDIQVMLIWNRNLLQRYPLQDVSTKKGIQVISELREKEKVTIVNMIVPQNLSVDQTKFYTLVNVSNKGFVNASTGVYIYLSQQQSLIPQVEGIIDIPGLTSEKIILGKNDTINITKNNYHKFNVVCNVRETEQDKNEFFIQAEVYVRIDGVDYIVDTSSYYGIIQNQPSPDNTYMNIIIIIVALFSGLIAIALIAFIIRILYPLYKIKKVTLKKERENIERRMKR